MQMLGCMRGDTTSAAETSAESLRPLADSSPASGQQSTMPNLDAIAAAQPPHFPRPPTRFPPIGRRDALIQSVGESLRFQLARFCGRDCEKNSSPQSWVFSETSEFDATGLVVTKYCLVIGPIYLRLLTAECSGSLSHFLGPSII